jgi:putative DNA primase/helicase
MEGDNITDNGSFEQELEHQVGNLISQRECREERIVDITLDGIVSDVVSKEQEISGVLMGSQRSEHNKLQQIVVDEIIRAADNRLWCREYVEKLKCDQQMMVYVQTRWESVEPQQWKDFVKLCAKKCGIPDHLLKNPSFMKKLFESAAFNFAAYRKQEIPKNEVWINLQNGTLVISADGTVTLRSHRMEDLFTYTIGYGYDADAECEQWHKFLDRVLPDKNAQQLLAEFIGYCLMPDHRMEKMLILYGDGQNGKSVTLEIIESILGSQNVSYLGLSDLTNDEVKRAGIEAKMLKISHESGKDVNPNILKQITSGERVTIKRLYRDPYETSNYGKLIAAFNQLPRAENVMGFFRRLIILPYNVTIQKNEIDRQLTQKLRTELAGILNWVLAYLPGFMKGSDFVYCEECEKALEEYKLQSDNVRLFVQMHCEESPYSQSGDNIFKSYRTFCSESGLQSLGKTKFYKRLENLKIKSEEINNKRYYFILPKE